VQKITTFTAFKTKLNTRLYSNCIIANTFEY